jgi:hypothetical protein
MKHCTVLYMSHDCLRMFHDVLRLSHVAAKVCRFPKNRVCSVCSAIDRSDEPCKPVLELTLALVFSRMFEKKGNDGFVALLCYNSSSFSIFSINARTKAKQSCFGLLFRSRWV